MEKISPKTLLSELKAYLLVIVLFWVLVSVALFEWGYEGSFIQLNSRFHSGISDKIAWLFTHLADGILLPLVILLMMWRRDKALVFTSLVLILGTGLVTQILKHVFFGDWNRPPLVFANNPLVNFVPVHPEQHNSFPSGHATSFAAGGLAFAWYFRKYTSVFQVFIGLFTILLCYTRVHLGVHFPGDIFAGTLIGTLVGLVLFKVVYPPLARWFGKNEPGKLDEWETYILIGAALLALLRFVQMAFF